MFRTAFSIATAILLLLAGCTGSEKEARRAMENGAIRYEPARSETIHPPKGYFPRSIIDDVTGYELRREWQTVRLPGHGGEFLHWKIDRRRQNLPPIYFLTKGYLENADSFFGRRGGSEIVLAYEDGFFPFEDALYPSDFSFERVVVMLDAYRRLDGRRGGGVYLDNRLAYRERNAEAGRLRSQSPFLPANFENNPMTIEGAEIFFPVPGRVKYDAASKTAIAEDGSKLTSDNETWGLGVDVSGMHSRVHATWSDATGNNQTRIVIIPLRGYRKGYGATRAAQLIVEQHSPVSRTIPSGSALAELINMCVPIAGEHAGNMIVIDNRTREGEWR